MLLGFRLVPSGGGGGVGGVFTSWSIGTKNPILKFFSSETERRTALTFGFYHLLVDLYQVCSYDAGGVKTGPATGVTSWNIGTKKTNFKILLL